MTDSFYDMRSASDQDLKETLEATKQIQEMTTAARAIVDNPDQFTKEEVVAMLDATSQLLNIFFPGLQMITESLLVERSFDPQSDISSL